MNTTWQDLRYGLRMLLKHPAFALIAVMALALGVGANTAIFSLADKLLLRSLPVKDPERIVLINSVSVTPHFVSNIFSWPDYVDYRDQNQVFSHLSAFASSRLKMQREGQIGGRTEHLAGEIVSGDYFDLLGVSAAQGRTFAPEEYQTPGTHPVVVISDGLWKRAFGLDPNVVGKTIALNDVAFDIIGVAPRGFNGMQVERAADVWVPALMDGQLRPRARALTSRSRWLRLMGRLKEGGSAVQGQVELDALAQQLKEATTPQAAALPFSEQHIEFEPGGKGVSGLRSSFGTPLQLLMAFVGLVLLIACANVANLLLARGVARRKEIAVRLALGASRVRLVRQLLTESLMFAVLGGLGGLMLAPWITELLLRFQPALDLARTPLSESLDLRVLAFNALVTTFAGIAFGLIPALQASKPDLVPALKDETGRGDRRERLWNARNALVVGQVALAFVVLVAAGLLINSLRHLFSIDPGFQTRTVLLVPFTLEPKHYDEAKGRAFHQQLIDRVNDLPGVVTAATSEMAPLSNSFYRSAIFVGGYTPSPNEDTAVDCNFVGSDYHEAMGIPIVRGRGFTDQDRKGTPGVAIINEAMARRFFPGQDPVGKTLSLDTGGPTMEIVGVSGNVKHQDLTEDPVQHLDLPAVQERYNSSVTLVVRTTGDTSLLQAGVLRELQTLDRLVAVTDVKTMADILRNSIATQRLAATITGMFGALALILAAIGLYGVMSYKVSQRTREIGIRMALGAEARDVLRLVIAQGIGLVLIGAGMGLAVSLGLTRFLASLLYEVTATDPLTFALIALLLVGVALLACYIPARRATRVDPMVALRYE